MRQVFGIVVIHIPHLLPWIPILALLSTQLPAKVTGSSSGSRVTATRVEASGSVSDF